LPRFVHREQDVLPAVTLGNLELAVEHDEKRVARVALPQHQLPCGDGDRLSHLIQLLQILFREVCEEGNLAQLVEHHRTLLRNPAGFFSSVRNTRQFISGSLARSVIGWFVRPRLVWFSPSLEDADAGANWYRCDVVAPRSEGKLLPLPPRLKGVLDKDGALDRFGTCGTAAPDAPGFSRVVCSEKHKWRAIETMALPSDKHYLAKDVTAAADSRCKDVASERANGSLKFTWSFEWPPRAQWNAGQRWGYCWVPET
jgi:hypothetical protein